jgi:hypothetical protein
VFEGLDGQEGGRPVHTSCPRLEASIEYAVHEGLLQVGSGVDPLESDPNGVDRE